MQFKAGGIANPLTEGLYYRPFFAYQRGVGIADTDAKTGPPPWRECRRLVRTSAIMAFTRTFCRVAPEAGMHQPALKSAFIREMDYWIT